MIGWFRKMLEAGKDKDRFWREYHISRREKRLEYFRKKREEALLALESAEACIAYYEDKLAVVRDDQRDAAEESAK